MDNHSFLGLSDNDFHLRKVFPFSGTWCKFEHYFVFQSFVQIIFSRQPVALSGDFIPLKWLSQTNFSKCQFLNYVCNQTNYVLVLFIPWKRHILHFSCFFEKHDFELKVSVRDRFWISKNTTRQVLNIKKYEASYFEFKKKQRVWFWVKKFTKCQILSVILLYFAKISFNRQNRACFCNVLMYGLGSISQVILLE